MTTSRDACFVASRGLRDITHANTPALGDKYFLLPQRHLWQSKLCTGTSASPLNDSSVTPPNRLRFCSASNCRHTLYSLQDKNLIKAAVDRLNDPDLDEEEKF